MWGGGLFSETSDFVARLGCLTFRISGLGSPTRPHSEHLKTLKLVWDGDGPFSESSGPACRSDRPGSKLRRDDPHESEGSERSNRDHEFRVFRFLGSSAPLKGAVTAEVRVHRPRTEI